jgi:hypothetical protein
MVKKITICLGIVIILFSISYNEYKTVWNPELIESRNEDNTGFLSDEYFNELNELFEQVKLENDKWYVFDSSKKIAAKIVIIKMMKDLESNPIVLKNHENFNHYFETFDKYIRKVDSVTVEMHFFRNTLNSYSDAPKRLDEMITLAATDKWKLFSAKYHRYNFEGINGALNVKFVSSDGRFETVYNTGTGEIVTDPINMGTYNYAPGSINPIGYYKHNTFDKIPWKKWGNIKGVSYQHIMSLESKHSSEEAKNNTKKVEILIEQQKQN